MNDDERLRNLIARGCERSGWNSKHMVNSVFYASRNLMKRLGGFDALCLAEAGEIQSWLNTKVGSPWTAYGNLRCICHTYDFLVEEGVIGFNPAVALKIGVPTRDVVRRKPPVDLKDLRRVFAHAKRGAFTIEGAKAYVAMCLKIRVGVQYSAMAKCRCSDLELSDGGGSLRASIYRKNTRREAVYQIDEETAWALRNYLGIRGPVEPHEPLIAKSGYHGTEIGGFYRNSILQAHVSRLFDQCGLKVRDYDLGKTVVMLAYAEGANAVQAAALAAKDSVTLAARVAEELPCADPGELRRKLLMDYDSDEVVAVGTMRAEDVMAAVQAAYKAPFVKVVIAADGWARFELPDDVTPGLPASPSGI